MAAEPKDIQEKFARLGFEGGALPKLCNRFQVFPREDGLFILAIGGVGVASLPSMAEPWTHIEMAETVVFNREFALDLSTTLQFIGQFTPQELEQSKNRVLGAIPQPGK